MHEKIGGDKTTFLSSQHVWRTRQSTRTNAKIKSEEYNKPRYTITSLDCAYMGIQRPEFWRYTSRRNNKINAIIKRTFRQLAQSEAKVTQAYLTKGEVKCDSRVGIPKNGNIWKPEEGWMNGSCATVTEYNRTSQKDYLFIMVSVQT
jgi:hypothetical protein